MEKTDPKTAPVHVKAAGLYMICTLSKHDAEAKGYSDALCWIGEGKLLKQLEQIFFSKCQMGICIHQSQIVFWMAPQEEQHIALARELGVNTIERSINARGNGKSRGNVF